VIACCPRVSSAQDTAIGACDGDSTWIPAACVASVKETAIASLRVQVMGVVAARVSPVLTARGWQWSWPRHTTEVDVCAPCLHLCSEIRSMWGGERKKKEC
jgi:hypothetical protein